MSAKLNLCLGLVFILECDLINSVAVLHDGLLNDKIAFIIEALYFNRSNILGRIIGNTVA